MEDNSSQEVLPQDSAPSQAASSSGFPIKKILSFLIGFIVLCLIIVVVVVFVVPKFMPKKVEDVALNYWIIFEDPEPYNELAREFTKQYPNITVNIEKKDVKNDGKYIERLSTRIDNGTGPDVFRYHVSWLPQIHTILTPLPQDVVESVELDTKFFPLVKSDLKLGGAYYGVPMHFDSLALFINMDLFKASGIASYPKTWDDLISAANTLTVRDENDKIITAGVALGTYDNIAHASDIISLLMLQNGADLRDLAGEKKKQNAVDALKVYTYFAQGDTRVWDDTLENSKLAFTKGKLAMYIGYSWDIFDIKLYNPNLNFAVTTAPTILNRDISVASYWVEGVSDKTPHSKEAFEFLKFISSRKSLERLYATQTKTRTIGELYPRVDMVELLKDNVLAYPFVLQGATAKSTLFSSDTHDERMVDELNKYMGDAVRSIINDGTSPETAVETLAQGVAQKITQYESPVE